MVFFILSPILTNSGVILIWLYTGFETHTAFMAINNLEFLFIT